MSTGKGRLLPTSGHQVRSTVAVVLAVTGLLGCGADNGPRCAEGKTQTLSMPCCLEWGVDACGAGLFCATLDGRTQSTCYPERTRLDLQECTANVMCLSGACNRSWKKCMSLPGGKCEGWLGCAPHPVSGKSFACRTSPEPAVCQEVEKGQAGAYCVEARDCASGVCSDDTCIAKLGQGCSSSSGCPAGATCIGCNYSDVWCPGGGSAVGPLCLLYCPTDKAYQIACR